MTEAPVTNPDSRYNGADANSNKRRKESRKTRRRKEDKGVAGNKVDPYSKDWAISEASGLIQGLETVAYLLLPLLKITWLLLHTCF